MASRAKMPTQTHSSGRGRADDTCQTSVLMNRKVMNSSRNGRARVASGPISDRFSQAWASAQRPIRPTRNTLTARPRATTAAMSRPAETASPGARVEVEREDGDQDGRDRRDEQPTDRRSRGARARWIAS